MAPGSSEDRGRRNPPERFAQFEAIGDGFLVLDSDRQFIHINPAGARVFGRRREEIVGRQLADVVPEAVGSVFTAAVERAAATGKPVYIEEFFAPWGRWFENRVYPTQDEVWLFFRDVTERERTELQSRELQARLQLALRAGGVGLWDWDLVTNEVYFSPEWKALIGYADDEVPSRFEEWASRLHPGDRERMERTLAAYHEHPWPNYEVEFRLRHRDGSYRWILAKADLVRDPEGRPVRMLGSHVDITERKHAEEDLRASRERLRPCSS